MIGSLRKKVLFLGGAPTQLTPIRYAIKQGHYVITCDNRPKNPGHKLAHESHNVSTTNKEAVLALARRKNIDGVVAYASDPAAPTAAYVAEQLGLPGSSYESVLVLSYKDRFRKFQKENAFNAPRSKTFSAEEPAFEWLKQIALPAYVKPVDSSGGKGITVLDDSANFSRAFEHALKFSLVKRVVVEEKIDRMVGYQNDSDAFMVDGKLQFWIWSDCRFNYACDPPFQSSISFPSILSKELSIKASIELERLLQLLGFKIGAFNVEFVVDADDEIWFLEVGARNGGGRIGDTIKLATGVDLAKFTVDAALGEDCSSLENRPARGYWAECLLSSLDSGELQDIWLSDVLNDKVYEKDIWVKPGDYVYRATGSNHALGTMIFQFDSLNEMADILDNINDHINVKVTRMYATVET